MDDFNHLFVFQNTGNLTYIPTYEDRRNLIMRMIRERRNMLNDPGQTRDEELLIDTYNMIYYADTYHEILPLLTEIGISLKEDFYIHERYDLWYGLITSLSLIMDRNLPEHMSDQYAWSRNLYREVERLTDTKIDHGNAVETLKDTVEAHFQKAEQTEWLYAQIEFLEDSIAGSGQHDKDKLKQEILSTLQLTRSVKDGDLYPEMRLLIIMSRFYKRHYNYPEMFVFAQQGFVLAKHMGREVHQSRALTLMATYLTNKKRNTDDYLKALLEYWSTLPAIEIDIYASSYYLSIMGKMHYREEKFEEAVYFYWEAVRLYHKLDHPLNVVLNSIGLGMGFAKMGQHDNAKEVLYSSIRVSEEANLIYEKVWAMYAYGWNFLLQEDFQRAVVYLQDALREASFLPEGRRKTSFSKSIKEDLDKAESRLRDHGKSD